jgi:CBS domain-containing protein
MVTSTKSLLTLTAADLMTREVVMIPREMSLHAAARLLSQHRVSGAPVVDEVGRCVGVLSATDFVHWAEEGEQARGRRGNNSAFCASWQIVSDRPLAEDAVGNYMTDQLVTVPPGKLIGDIARMMINAHIHRVIVVDELDRPLGIVSSTDILAAVAHAEPHE